MRLLRETRPSHLIADFAAGGLSKLDLGTALPPILSSRLNQRAARMGNKVSCVRAIGTAGRFGLNPGLSSREYSSVAGDLFTYLVALWCLRTVALWCLRTVALLRLRRLGWRRDTNEKIVSWLDSGSPHRLYS